MVISIVVPTLRRTKKRAHATIGEGDPPTRTEKSKSFIHEMWTGFRNAVVNFVRDVYQHTEAVIILILSSLGLNALLGELPFYMSLPMWIEATMVIPIASVLIISGLLWSATTRANRRAVA